MIYKQVLFALFNLNLYFQHLHNLGDNGRGGAGEKEENSLRLKR